MSNKHPQSSVEVNAIADCPPSDADGATGVVFRCCSRNPINKSEMLTAEESDRLHNAPACLRRALSVFRTREDAEHQVRLFRGWRKRFIARAALENEHGKTKLTSGQQPTHTSWWPADDVAPQDRAQLFTVVTEVTQ